VARKVVWYDQPEQTLADLKTQLSGYKSNRIN
jgi:hypothetical protein